MTRVIAGTLRGRRLVTPEGMDTRPTMDKTKEALFGAIQFDVPGSRFLDLFAGSGGVGIEALSRGADSLELVECDSRALKAIRQNLRDLGLEDRSRVLPVKAERIVETYGCEGRQFDIIFMDPPYHQGWEEKVGNLIAESGILSPGGMLIIESSSETDVRIETLDLFKVKTYKTARFSFFRRKEAPPTLENV
ncbi:MAG: 16S rRNA (guanine(966)-N(2))-methyltransferase RsmD [Lachnospiraceae bacterium]|nr:16S rRNA (guanine(966)-N(2))-methyltransferase RsmD [Lachnospiraceae bacterium]